MVYGMEKSTTKKIHAILIISIASIASAQYAQAAFFDLENQKKEGVIQQRSQWYEDIYDTTKMNRNQIAYQHLVKAIAFFKKKDFEAVKSSLDLARSNFVTQVEKSPNIFSYNGLIKIALLEQNFTQAEKWLNDASGIGQKNTETRYLHAKLLILQNDFSKAKTLLQQVIKENDSYKLAYSALAEISIREKDSDLAEQYYKRLLELDSQMPIIYSNLANLYESEGRTDAAIEILEQGFETLKNTNDYGRYIAKALSGLYVKHNKPKKALQVASSFYEIFPDDNKALSLYIDVLLINQMQAQAEKLLEKRISNNKNDDDARLKLIILLSKNTSNKGKITDHFEKLIDNHKSNPSAYFALTRYLIKNKHFSDASKIIAKIRDNFPKSNFADLLSADLNLEKGELKLAGENYLSAYQISKNNNLLVKTIQTLIAANQKDLAINFLTTEIENSNKNVARLTLAGIYLDDKNFVKAEHQFRTVLKNNPNHFIALNDLAWMLSQQNKNKEALPLVKKAYSVAPHSVEVLDTYIKILKELGFNKKAALLTRNKL